MLLVVLVPGEDLDQLGAARDQALEFAAVYSGGHGRLRRNLTTPMTAVTSPTIVSTQLPRPKPAMVADAPKLSSSGKPQHAAMVTTANPAKVPVPVARRSTMTHCEPSGLDSVQYRWPGRQDRLMTDHSPRPPFIDMGEGGPNIFDDFVSMQRYMEAPELRSGCYEILDVTGQVFEPLLPRKLQASDLTCRT